MTPQFKAGDRIVLSSMSDDPNPISAGSKGTVQDATIVDFGAGAWEQVFVDWDSGRKLMLTIPPDVAYIAVE